ncbi:hypothetical protein SH580_13010 [Coraliomargarita algicola]|uniref:Aminopeptidase n=1 Tax=Coraliomargarita algicola TaxID=3092156 RepID=A0ABZ0RHT6_9BACT|nr:hypothetical protein [Coraliomargarita sp. J2-16]WPJ94355.1 hypothetical protein SH580_13010 [Coraliomargarita sp. J2-16]
MMDNPKVVIWSHSDHRADFYELPTDGAAMHVALGWLLQHYAEVKLWMGVETSEGAELYLTGVPAQAALVEQLRVYEEEPSIFEEITGISAACVNE